MAQPNNLTLKLEHRKALHSNNMQQYKLCSRHNSATRSSIPTNYIKQQGFQNFIFKILVHHISCVLQSLIPIISPHNTFHCTNMHSPKPTTCHTSVVSPLSSTQSSSNNIWYLPPPPLHPLTNIFRSTIGLLRECLKQEVKWPDEPEMKM